MPRPYKCCHVLRLAPHPHSVMRACLASHAAGYNKSVTGITCEVLRERTGTVEETGYARAPAAPPARKVQIAGSDHYRSPNRYSYHYNGNTHSRPFRLRHARKWRRAQKWRHMQEQTGEPSPPPEIAARRSRSRPFRHSARALHSGCEVSVSAAQAFAPHRPTPIPRSSDSPDTTLRFRAGRLPAEYSASSPAVRGLWQYQDTSPKPRAAR